MNALKRRLELVERARGHKGRLIVVRSGRHLDEAEALAVASTERRPGDTVIQIRRVIVDPPGAVRSEEDCPIPFFASIDGQPVHITKAAAW